MYRNLTNTGITKASNSSQSKKIRLLNIYSLTWSHLALIFLITDYFVGETKFYIVHFISLFLMSLVIYLNKVGLFKWAKVIWFSHAFNFFFSLSIYISPTNYFEYFFLLLSGVSISLYDSKKTSILVLIISYLLFLAPYYWIPIYSDKEIGQFKPVATFTLFLCVFLLIDYFKKLNLNNEKLLAYERDRILNDKITLQEQQEELKKLQEFKSHFFVNISHEIRTPLTLIKGYASRMDLPESDFKNKESLSIIKSQTQQIQDIVDSILDLGKLENNKLQINKAYVELIPFIKKIYADFDGLFRKKNISFIETPTELDLLILIDLDFFSKSITNLLHNAYKFTPKGGNIIFKVTYKDQLEISVIDNGIGIPKEDIEKVFKRFYQSKNDITKSQGSGIGLAFTKSIINAHNFTISLKSTPNIETNFTITIPQEAIKKIDTIKPSSKSVNFIESTETLEIKKTILIVEDHSEMRDYLKMVLKNYTIIEATNGLEALKAIKNYNFDLIITDYMMPVMDGEVFIKETKKLTIKTPIIAITARGDDNGKLNLLRLGIEGYITKPFTEEELLLIVEKSILNHSEINKDTIPNEELNLGDNELIFINHLSSIIEKNYVDKKFNIEVLANLMKLSKSSLFRKTKNYLEKTPNEIISEIRFKKAKQILIENPTIKKKDLADAVGIANATYFYKKLKDRF